MPNVFISPCGTSLLTNNVEANVRNLLFKTANYQENELTPEDKAVIAQHLQQRRELVLRLTDFQEIKKLSAELNGILTYYQNKIPHNGVPDQHYILVSDTYQGREVGKIIVAWLQQQKLQAEVVNIPDLATNEKDRFRLAMSG
jgi:CRISPR/Cas system-associated protein Csm6